MPTQPRAVANLEKESCKLAVTVQHDREHRMLA